MSLVAHRPRNALSGSADTALYLTPGSVILTNVFVPTPVRLLHLLEWLD